MVIATTGQLNLEEIPSKGSRTIHCFHKLQQIGQGTYAQVYKAQEIETGEIVALKKIRMENEKEGFPITAIREIKILQKLHHENVVKLKEIVTSPEMDEQGRPGGIYMVFEYMDHDLAGLTRCSAKFSVPQIKCYLRQLLMGLHYCHVNQVLHRDIKGANLLIDNNGTLKLADFGLARIFANEHNGNLTNRVITLWYRPPELLMGSTKYGPAVDMWSVGCIFAELLVGKPLFPGKDESEQIFKIFELCGAPDESKWPAVKELPWYSNLKPNRPLKKRLREHFRLVDRHALELLEKMLVLDPSQRISTLAALDSEYFWADPLPCDPQSLPKYESSHEFLTKHKRQHNEHHEEAEKRLKSQHGTQICVLPMQQSIQGQAPVHSQRQAVSYQLKKRNEAVKYEKVQHPSAYSSGHANVPEHGGHNQQKRQDDEGANYQKTQHPAVYTHPLPNQQSVHTHAQWQTRTNQATHGSQAPATTAPGHHYVNPQGLSRYSQGGNSGGRNRPNYGSHGDRRGYDGASYGPSHGSSGMRASGHRGDGSGGFGSAKNHHHSSPYIGSSAGRGSNMISRRHNHQYGSR